MIFEFLVACCTTTEDDLKQTLTELLAEVLEDNQNDFDEDIVSSMIQLRHERTGGEVANDSGVISSNRLVGLALDLPDDTAPMKTVVENFARALPDTPPVSHAVKFEDPLLQAELANHAAEIFALEMKLRRVLSLVYLNAYQAADPFQLLRDEKTTPRGSPTLKQMETAGENEFFHLLFSDYISLNQRLPVTLETLLEMIHREEQYDTLRAEIGRTTTIDDEGDADLLADLKVLMDPIERMRNCVAHNRHPPERVTQSYPNALLRLQERLDEYLAQWEVRQ